MDSLLTENGVNMKLGYILLVHEELNVLSPLLDALVSSKNDHIFIHIDKKSPSYSQISKAYGHNENFHFIEQIDVEWGEASIIYATIAGMRIAQNYDIDYLILLSGSCMPIRSRSELIKTLLDKPMDYIECHSLKKGKWAKGGLEKERWSHYNLFNWRSDPIYFSLSHKIQDKLGIKRSLPGNIEAYMGSQWWCLRSTTVRLVVEFYEKYNINNFIKYSWIPDEFLIQSIVGSFIPEKEISNILVMYRFNDVGIPKIYKSYDINEIENSDENKFFVRKVHKNDNVLKDFLSSRYKGSSKDFMEKLSSCEPIKPSKKNFITDISVQNFNHVFIFLMDDNNVRYPDNVISNFKSKGYSFYGQLFSSSGIFLNDDIKSEDSYYKYNDTSIRDYNLELFSEKILNNNVNFVLAKLQDFDKVNYALRKFQLITYIIKTDNLATIDLCKAISIKKYLSSQGIDYILFNNNSLLVNDIKKSINNFTT